jgi:hypothetical protein
MKDKITVLKPEYIGKKLFISGKEIELSLTMTDKDKKKVIVHDVRNQKYFYFNEKVVLNVKESE